MARTRIEMFNNSKDKAHNGRRTWIDQVRMKNGVDGVWRVDRTEGQEELSLWMPPLFVGWNDADKAYMLLATRQWCDQDERKDIREGSHVFHTT